MVYRDGPETHWLLLKICYGNVEARRSAVLQIRKSEFAASFQNVVAPIFSDPVDPKILETRGRQGRRRAELLFPALFQATMDPDSVCRADAIKALDVITWQYGSDAEKDLVLRRVISATRDKDDSVRTAAVGSLAGLAKQNMGAVFDAIRLALVDPTIEVRQASIRELGKLGVLVPTSQTEVASILIPLLESREDPRIRVTAVWAISYFGTDIRRHPAGAGPDVVPSLVAALHDSDVDVRRKAAIILGSTSPDARGSAFSSWDMRKDSIIPSLLAATSDDDKAVREDAALALFTMGRRDVVVIELIEQAAHNSARSQKARIESALKAWQIESDAGNPAAETK